MTTPPQRSIDGRRLPTDNSRHDTALRPRNLETYIGQSRVVENLKVLIQAARQRSEPLDHILFYGPPGLGKTTLAHVVANEMDASIKTTAGPTIERAGDLAAILTHQRAGDILFIDEIHRLSRAVEEVLYSAMEDFVLDIVVGKGPSAKNVRLNLPRFTIVGATTRLALLTAPLRDRFGVVFRMDFYDQVAMEQIITNAASKLGVGTEPDGVAEIARRSRGTPRVALRLLKRARDYAEVRAQGVITAEVASDCLSGLLQIDSLGLDEIDRRVLVTIIENFDGGPVGLETIAASISEEADTIMDVIEPFLLQLGFIERTQRGRMVTRRAYEHLGYAQDDLDLPPQQEPLF